MTSAAPATWANWGLYSMPVTTGSSGTIRRGSSASREQTLDQAADDAGLDLGERALGLVGGPGPPSMWSTRDIVGGQRDLEHALPSIGSAEKIVRYVVASSESTYSA